MFIAKAAILLGRKREMRNLCVAFADTDNGRLGRDRRRDPLVRHLHVLRLYLREVVQPFLRVRRTSVLVVALGPKAGLPVETSAAARARLYTSHTSL